MAEELTDQSPLGRGTSLVILHRYPRLGDNSYCLGWMGHIWIQLEQGAVIVI